MEPVAKLSDGSDLLAPWRALSERLSRGSNVDKLTSFGQK